MYLDNLENPTEFQGHRPKLKVTWVLGVWCVRRLGDLVKNDHTITLLIHPIISVEQPFMEIPALNFHFPLFFFRALDSTQLMRWSAAGHRAAVVFCWRLTSSNIEYLGVDHFSGLGKSSYQSVVFCTFYFREKCKESERDGRAEKRTGKTHNVRPIWMAAC